MDVVDILAQVYAGAVYLFGVDWQVGTLVAHFARSDLKVIHVACDVNAKSHREWRLDY